MNKKHQISYTKPNEPAFLKEFKKRAGYVEPDSIDTKRQKIENCSDSDSDIEGRTDEKPEVVVLKPGDLTAEEAEREEERIKREENGKKADLSQKVVFKAKSRGISNTSAGSSTCGGKSKDDKQKAKKNKEIKSKLSFDEEEADD